MKQERKGTVIKQSGGIWPEWMFGPIYQNRRRNMAMLWPAMADVEQNGPSSPSIWTKCGDGSPLQWQTN
jgi:hypothetical protein